jgi:hypothetical protein
MRALSLRPWWAELVMLGRKTTEYRPTQTHVRGRVYVYATLGGRLGPDDAAYIREEYGVELDADSLPRGVLVGTVEVYCCRPAADGYEWLLRDPQRAEKLLRPTRPPQPVWFNPF